MKQYVVEEKQGYYEVRNANGSVLGMHTLKLIEQDGLAFKDLAGCGELLPYEDWRLDAKTRAKDLAARLSIEEIAGLMLWSSHQMVPFVPGSPFVGHYDGAEYQPGVTDPASLTDEQIRYVQTEQIRNILLNYAESADAAARWNNHLQALAENSRWGIPVCISSDPRHASGSKTAEFSGEGREVSRWPEGMGMAATFDPELMGRFAKIVAKEYRALGITLALGPQIDLATDPRWMRFEDTWGGNVEMTTAFARQYCDGLQTTEGSPDGWGKDSVAAMVKHWPGGGTGEGGRDAHYAYGKYAVFPGDRLEEHMTPFAQGAFQLQGPTGKAACVMPYYTISWDQDKKYGENVGNSYSTYIIQDLLRRREQYDGVICTDWGVTADPKEGMAGFGACSHGMEWVPEAERYLKIMENTVDMFGGCNRKEPVLQAYEIGCKKHGEKNMRMLMEASAGRILTVMFRLGLFDHPYVDAEASSKVVGCEEYLQAGREAQRRSAVLLKNRNQVLPLKKGTKVYVPKRQIGAYYNFFRMPVPAQTLTALTQAEAGDYLQLVDSWVEADAALIFAESPQCDCYSVPDTAQGGNGYLPITLQYRPYTAEVAREHSIAKGDDREGNCDRSYRGKTNTARNESDLDNILEARNKMGDKPVIVCLQLHNASVVGEFEPAADGILAHFGVEKQVMMEILTGEAVPGGRLPIILPRDMETVERHCEDVFEDMIAYTDEVGNRYGYGFGLHY